jgi:hypothetical protein
MRNLKRDTIEKTIEKIREELNRLAGMKEVNLCEGEVLRLSRELDKLIYMHYSNKYLP